jgi:hypothetical protein
VRFKTKAVPPSHRGTRIFDLSWTRDGKQLLLAKGENTSDVVLIRNFRQFHF